MQIQIGKNPEYTFYCNYDWTYWALPIAIYWCSYSASYGFLRSGTLKFLCFCFTIERWKWNEQKAKPERKE